MNVVGIAGDEISGVRSQGDEVVPYTLWAELASQIGGNERVLSRRSGLLHEQSQMRSSRSPEVLLERSLNRMLWKFFSTSRVAWTAR